MSLFVATPADVSLLMQLGVDGVFVGSGIFKSSCPQKRARAMAQAVTHYKDSSILADLSSDLGTAMFGTPASQRQQTKGALPFHDKEQIWNATLGNKSKNVSWNFDDRINYVKKVSESPWH